MGAALADELANTFGSCPSKGTMRLRPRSFALYSAWSAAFTKAATPGPDEEEIATGQARSPFEEDEGAFDFEEAVFGGVDEPLRSSKRED